MPHNPVQSPRTLPPHERVEVLRSMLRERFGAAVIGFRRLRSSHSRDHQRGGK